SVVDEHHRLPMEVERRPVAAVRELAAAELLGLSFGYAVDQLVLEAQLANDGLVDHADAAGCDRTHRQLGPRRNAGLADEEDVERRAQGSCHLSRNRNAATGQPEHDGVDGLELPRQALAQEPPCLGSVVEPPTVRHAHRNHVLLRVWSARAGIGVGKSESTTVTTIPSTFSRTSLRRCRPDARSTSAAAPAG